MKLESLLTILLTAGLASYMLRMIVNWELLNRVNGTSYPNLRSPGPAELILTFRHLVTSVMKLWWRDGENSKEVFGTSRNLQNLSVLFERH